MGRFRQVRFRSGVEGGRWAIAESRGGQERPYQLHGRWTTQCIPLQAVGSRSDGNTKVQIADIFPDCVHEEDENHTEVFSTERSRSWEKRIMTKSNTFFCFVVGGKNFFVSSLLFFFELGFWVLSAKRSE